MLEGGASGWGRVKGGEKRAGLLLAVYCLSSSAGPALLVGVPDEC